MKIIEEAARGIPVKGHYDVVVAGGGVAGISAALAAKRTGAQRVLLVDKLFFLGGLATAGLVTIYVPLCDGEGNLVATGIAEELLRLSVSQGHEEWCNAWLDGGSPAERKKERFRVQFNAQLFALLCEKLLIAEGVELLYGTSICNVQKDEDRIQALIFENKSGRTAVTVGSVVDATGDADVCALCGCPTQSYAKGNSLAAWHYTVEGGKYTMQQIGFVEMPDDRWDKDLSDKVQTSTNTLYTGLSGEDTTRMSIDAHQAILGAFLKKGSNTDTHALATIASIPQLRMTRRIAGEYTLDESEAHRQFDDSIGMISHWRKRGPVFEIPFGCLYHHSVKNLAVAGRCISVTDDMWDVSRVIPPCAITGQAAGTAAALSVDFTTLKIKKLQEKLLQAGVLLHKNW